MTPIIQNDTLTIQMKSSSVHNKKDLEALRYIRNTVAHEGKSPSIRDIMVSLGYKSPHSAMLVVNKLIHGKFLRRKANGVLEPLYNSTETPGHAQTVNIPLVGSVPCGAPLLAEENIQGMIPVSTRLIKPSHHYFLLRAVGDSMNKKGIPDGSLILVRQQPDADNGEAVVALINDEATVKELHKGKDAIILQPRSTNTQHKPIILSDDFEIQGVVVATLPNLVT